MALEWEQGMLACIEDDIVGFDLYEVIALVMLFRSFNERLPILSATAPLDRRGTISNPASTPMAVVVLVINRVWEISDRY
jgi:hypothetical protein